jgi:hypothetical protein
MGSWRWARVVKINEAERARFNITEGVSDDYDGRYIVISDDRGIKLDEFGPLRDDQIVDLFQVFKEDGTLFGYHVDIAVTLEVAKLLDHLLEYVPAQT